MSDIDDYIKIQPPQKKTPDYYSFDLICEHCRHLAISHAFIPVANGFRVQCACFDSEGKKCDCLMLPFESLLVTMEAFVVERHVISDYERRLPAMGPLILPKP